MLKLILAQLGVTIDQEMVDKILTDVQQCFTDIRSMRDSQERSEAMLKRLTVAHDNAIAIANVKARVEDDLYKDNRFPLSSEGRVVP